MRDRRAADRSVTAWARTHSADLRVLAAQLCALTDLAPDARPAQNAVHTALAAADAADLIPPLAAMRPHLESGHRDLADRLDDLTRHADHLRHASNQRRA
ncbi:hypothetical protein LN042_24015 [Kitasatospora sp. RB6PN24]|uniref:hypothetical protein n=1 Tax=Kitasatospora humi TaxID=2893891 RepID=UPI001E3E1F26|nr:hypothetical protein [Kitasatospora humi]MCC9310096.1 hypothetical protein [Kitasatospora humi]